MCNFKMLELWPSLESWERKNPYRNRGMGNFLSTVSVQAGLREAHLRMTVRVLLATLSSASTKTMPNR